jgi:hypothetical protein
MPATSRRERIARLQRALISSERYVAALLVVESHDGEELIRVGGCWDRELRKFVDRPVEPRRVRLEESQIELGRALARWLQLCREGKRRPRVLMGGGNRGSGKTWFLAGVTFVVMALEFPGDWQYGVNITSKQKRECIEAIKEVAPVGWIFGDVEDFRDPRTIFLTGNTVAWLSANNPRAIRQAGLPIRYVLINEGQDQPEAVANNAIAAIRNTGGLVGVATNPPQTERSDWVASWWLGIEDGGLNGEKYFIDNKLNRKINQDALPDIAGFLYATNPDAGDADALGIMKLSGNVGYPGFSRGERREENGVWVSGHVGEPPKSVVDILGNPLPGSWIDVTREITAEHSKSEAGFDFVGGSDFQTEPGSCAAIAKLYRTPSGQIVLAVREFVASTGVESDLTLALNSRGYFPGTVDYEGRPAASLLLIGDATGARQNAEHRKRDPYSFTRLRADGWSVLPPFVVRNQAGGRTPMNPLVEDSRKQMKACFLAGAILISPACSEPASGFPSLTEALARAKVNSNGKFEKKGHYTHGPDCVRYLAWRFLPRNVATPAPKSDGSVADAVRNIRIFTSS